MWPGVWLVFAVGMWRVVLGMVVLVLLAVLGIFVLVLLVVLERAVLVLLVVSAPLLSC